MADHRGRPFANGEAAKPLRITLRCVPFPETPMGDQSRAPAPAQVTAPTTEGPATQPAVGGNSVSRTQRNQGNAAAQAALAENTPADAITGTQTALAQNTSAASVSVGGQLPAHMLLGKVGDNEVKTQGATGFQVGVGRSGLWANFHPALLIEQDSFWGSLATGGISVSQLYFDFKSGKASLSFDTGRMGSFLDWFMDMRAGIESKFASGIKAAMPGWVTGGNYDPYTDPDLALHLQGVVNAMASTFPAGGGGGGIAEKVSNPEFGFHATPIPTKIPLSEGMSLVFTREASIDLTARMQGSLKDATTRPKLKDLTVRSEGVNVEHNTWGILAGIRVHALTLGPDMSVKDFQYTLGLEDGVGLLKMGALLLQMRTGQDLGVRDMNRPELNVVRERIDRDCREKLPAALREQIKRLAGDMAGSPLAGLLDGPK